MTHRFRTKPLFTILPLIILCLSLIVVTIAIQFRQTTRQHAAGTTTLSNLDYAGVDYVYPSPTFTKCAEWTWLTDSCYNTLQPNAQITAKALFASDMDYIKANDLGNTEHIWISLDELFDQSKWNATTGYGGYNSQALANVSDMLHTLNSKGLKADLVLYIWVNRTNVANQFHPEALDGNHDTMRAKYLQAMKDFVSYLAADPLDASTVSVMDMHAEAYYQNDVYFHTGTSNTSTLGKWAYTEPAWSSDPSSAYTKCHIPGNNQCTGGGANQGCILSSGNIDTNCVDVNITYPWLKDLYTTAHATAPNFLYTVSDSGGSILTTETTNQYITQSAWESMYPVDIYDLHLYYSSPWTDLSRWQTGESLNKPWIVDDVGCSTADNLANNCTYVPSLAYPNDHWWLANLHSFGAQAVMVDQADVTAWTQPAVNQRILTSVGTDVASFNTTPSLTLAPFSVPYTGTDYVGPSGGLTGCQFYSAFQSNCYTNTTLTSWHISPQQLMSQNFTFLHNNNGGDFQRVWISLDELFSCFDGTNGFCGYDQQALSNITDMLRMVASNHMKVDLVLFANSNQNPFHFEALDGKHNTMRANYITALKQFVQYIANDPTAASAVGVMDLENEGYYQNEKYFHAGTTDLSTLGNWAYQEPAWSSDPNSAYGKCLTKGNTQCTGGSDGHGCVTASGGIDNACVDINISYPWINDIYSAAKQAAPQFNYTVSDTGRLLSTDSCSTSPYTCQTYWISMFPVDVYDIHLYVSNPQNSTTRWATAKNLPHPWFSGETGTANTGNATQSCYTYSGSDSCTIATDTWWRQHLGPDYGSSAVLIEMGSNIFTYPNGPSSLVYTQLGQALANLAIPTLSITLTSTPVPSNSPTLTPLPQPTNTPIPTSKPTATPTTKPTATPLPTTTPVPTNTPIPQSTLLSFPSILLQGLGKAGDSVNPGSNGNLTPLHPSRTVTVSLYNGSAQLVTTKTGTITYQTATGDFTGTVDLGTGFSSGTYTVKVSVPQFLVSQVVGFYQVTQGQSVTLPQFSMVVGDANGDNKLDILDYNMLLGCYSDLAPATNCPGNNKALTDFSDDGAVNQSDYNLFLRELSVRTGQ